MLTALEIKKQEFSRAMRGYDITEVRTFLETVASQIEKLTAQVTAQATELDKLNSGMESYRRLESNMKDALVNSQESVREARDAARKEAELTRREAELNAEKILSAARREEEDIRREIEALQNRRDSFVRKISSLLRSELELLDLLEKEEKHTQ